MIILSGVLSGLICPMIIWGLIRGAVTAILGISGFDLLFTGIKLNVNFTIDKASFINGIILLLPYLLTMVAIEIIILSLTKTEPGKLRLYLVIFALVLSGFYIFDLFYGAFFSLLDSPSVNDMYRFIKSFGFDTPGKLAITFLVLITSAGYLNLASKRIIKYINL